MSVAFSACVHRAEHDALVHPEHVARRQDHPERRDRPPTTADAERPEQDQELADEAVHSGQADRTQHDDQEDHREHRDHLPQPAEVDDAPRVPPLVDDADQQEQRAGRDAVVQHGHHRARESLGVEREQTQHAEAQVAHRRVGDQLLEVRLHHRDERAVDDSDERQPRDPRARTRRARSGTAACANRRKPYVPILSSTAARITEPAVGASTCASGSQVWNGHIGTLIANANANARNSQSWVARRGSPAGSRTRRSNVVIAGRRVVCRS